MKGFALTNGDLSITKNEIDMVEGDALKVQTIQSVLSTNKGEWLFDTDEGIDFNSILGKHRVKTKTTPMASFYGEELSKLRKESNEQNSAIERLEKRLSGE